MQNNIEVGDSVKVHDPLFTKRPTWGTVTDVSPVTGGVDVRFDDTSDLTNGWAEDHADGDPLDGHADVRALRDRLEERSAVEVGVEDGAPVLRVDKLGVTHTIAADGSVSDGPVADRLRDVAAEYLGGGPE